jgi:hypothetical protein
MEVKKTSLPVKGIFFGLGVSIVILLVIQKLFGNSIDPNLLRNFWHIALAGVIVFLFSLLIASLRIYMLLRSLGYSVPFFKTSLNVVLGQFFNAITPFAAGGQPYQIYELNSYNNVELSHATAVIITQYLNLNFATSTIAIIFFSRYFNILATLGVTGKVFIIGMITTLSIGTLFTIVAFSRTLLIKFINFLKNRVLLLKIIEKITGKDKQIILNTLKTKLIKYNDSMKFIWAKSPKTIFLDYFLALGFVFFNYAVFYVIVIGFQFIANEKFGFTLLDSLSIQAFLSFIVYYLPTPGSSGGFESVMFISLKNFVPQEYLIVSISVWRMVIYYFLILMGTVLFIFHVKKSLGRGSNCS